MRLLFSEYPVTYEEYRFPYQVWAQEDSLDERESLLEQGFMPSRMKIGLWYLGRSSRIDLQQYEENSENRRIRKNTSDYHYHLQASDGFTLTTDIDWLLNSARKISDKFSKHSVKRMFSKHLSTEVFVWKHSDSDEVVGLVPVMIAGRSMFYWMAYYKDSAFVSGLGTRMMLEAVEWAATNQYSRAYLGTVYSEASLYKTNFNGFQFFNGVEWRVEKEELRYLLNRSDEKELFKDNEYLEKFYGRASMQAILGSRE